MFGTLCFNCRGDKAFCSAECRENFMEDEMEEGEPMIYHPTPPSPSSSPLDHGPIFQLIRWVNASNNLIWSYLKCCLRLISCSHGCDHVCRVVAWRFCLLRRWWIYLTYWFLCFCVLGSSNFWRSPKNDCTSGHIIILIGDGRVRVCLNFGCLDLSFSGCRMFDASVTIMYLNLCVLACISESKWWTIISINVTVLLNLFP